MTKHNRWRSVYMQSMRHVLKSNSPATARGEGLEGDNEELAAEILDTSLEARGDEGFGVFWKLGAQGTRKGR